MKIKLKKKFFISFSIILLYLIINQSCMFIGTIEGKYVLHSDGNCHLLSNDADTLTLKENGLLVSRNFLGNPVYEATLGFFEKEIEITFNDKKESMVLVIERGLLGGIKFRVCMDQNTYYVKI